MFKERITLYNGTLQKVVLHYNSFRDILYAGIKEIFID